MAMNSSRKHYNLCLYNTGVLLYIFCCYILVISIWVQLSRRCF